MSNETNPSDKKPPSNKELVEKAIRALNEKSKRAPCDFCGHTQLVIAQELVALIPLDVENGSLNLGKQFPCVALFCTNCGNTKLFNAKALNLL